MFSSEYCEIFKGNAQFVQKVTFKPLMDFKKFSSLKLSKQSFFFETVLFYIFISQILTDDFGGLHRNLRASFKNTYFEKHMLTTVSDFLKQL